MKNNNSKLTIILCFLLFGLTAQLSAEKYAIYIAIDNYAEIWDPLPNTVSDAGALKTLFRDKYKFNNIIEIYNEDATRENIIETLDKTVQDLNEEDELLVFFSGHGTKIGNEGYWVPQNAETQERFELLANSEVKNIFGKSKAKHILLISDAIFTGNSFKSANLAIQNDGSPTYYQTVNSLVSRQAITSGGLKPSYADNTSVLVKYIVKFLNRNTKENLDAGELYDLIKFPVSANSEHTPEFGYIQDSGHEGGQFIFKTSDAVDCNFSLVISQGNYVIYDEKGGEVTAVADRKTVDYKWYLNNSEIGKTSSLNITESGNYKVTATTNEGCVQEQTIQVKIEVNNADVFIKEGSSIQFTNKGTLHAESNVPNVSYEWKFNGFIISNKAELDVSKSGEYTVFLKNSNGDILTSSSTEVTVKQRTYTTKIGDSAERIAKLFYKDSEKAFLIKQANPSAFNNEGKLLDGVKIVIPPATTSSLMAESKSIQLAGVKDFAPLSGESIYNNGILTEVVNLAFSEAGITSSVDYVAWNDAKSSAFDGSHAAAFPVLKNEKDADNLMFSVPIYDALHVLFVKQGKTYDISNPKKLKSKVIAVKRGYNIDQLFQWFEAGYVQVRPCRTLEECFGLLEAGKVDMVATSQILGFTFLQEKETFKIEEFDVIPTPLETSSYHLAVSKSHPNGAAILQQFNEVYLKLKENGKVDEIINRHLDELQKE